MTPDLPAKYEQACKMLADLVKVDEVKAIRDKARAMEVYARQAKDTALINHATEIRLRAERRAGELLAPMEKNKGAVPGKTGLKGRPVLDATPKLADLGVTKSQSSRWQKLAGLDEAAFESKVSDTKRLAVASVEGNRASAFINSPHDERGDDLYETPPEVVRALLDAEPISGTIWECACGPGSIVRVLREAGHRVIATNLIDYPCPDSRGGVDFLAQTAAPEGARQIITNPPYKFASDFVRTALRLVPRVVMLLRLAFLESESRSDILEGGQLARVHVFRNRLPMMHRAGWTGSKIDSSAIPMAWFVWNRDHCGPPTLHRLSWRAEAEPQPTRNAEAPS